MISKYNIAILIPCYNEESTIGRVVREFKSAIPNANVYVFDNASTDQTAKVAKESGAIVFYEPKKGKGNVTKRMFADVEADIFVMVDGDATYESAKCSELITHLLDKNLDMVVGTRKAKNHNSAYRRGHIFGNLILTKAVAFLFGRGFTDMLSGYRVMSRRFVKSFPAMSEGFEIETELTIYALNVGASFEEIDTLYDSRPEGSDSKLNTFRDGFKILGMIILLFKEEKPFQFFGLISIVLFLISIILSFPIFITYTQTGLVPRIPTAILSTGIMILSSISLISGVILDSLSRARLEVRRINYLSYKSINIK